VDEGDGVSEHARHGQGHGHGQGHHAWMRVSVRRRVSARPRVLAWMRATGMDEGANVVGMDKDMGNKGVDVDG